MEQLIERLCSKYNVPSRAIISLLSRMKKQEFDNREIVINFNQRRQYYYIIAEGVWRSYRILNGEEITLWFERGDDVGYSEMTEHYIIESISKSSAYVLPKKELDELCEQSHEMSNLIRVMLEKFYLEITHWSLVLSIPTGKERYLALLQNDPDIFQWVPQRYIASYLGVTPQSLSRIRRQLMK